MVVSWVIFNCLMRSETVCGGVDENKGREGEKLVNLVKTRGIFIGRIFMELIAVYS